MNSNFSFESVCDGIERPDLSQVRDFLEHYYNPLKSFLTSSEIAALQLYKAMEYKDINTYMRTGDVPRAGDAHIADIEDTIELIESALTRGPLPASVVVYRGLKGAYPGTDIQVGDYLEEPSFLSTSLSVQTARQFCQWEAGHISSTILEISVPAGTPAIWLEGITEKGEHELLLGSDTLIHISAINNLHGYPERRYLQCQCVQQT